MRKTNLFLSFIMIFGLFVVINTSSLFASEEVEKEEITTEVISEPAPKETIEEAPAASSEETVSEDAVIVDETPSDVMETSEE